MLTLATAGFNYDFDSLNVHGAPNELNQAFTTVFNTLMTSSIVQYIRARYRLFTWIVRAPPSCR